MSPRPASGTVRGDAPHAPAAWPGGPRGAREVRRRAAAPHPPVAGQPSRPPRPAPRPRTPTRRREEPPPRRRWSFRPTVRGPAVVARGPTPGSTAAAAGPARAALASAPARPGRCPPRGLAGAPGARAPDGARRTRCGALGLRPACRRPLLRLAPGALRQRRAGQVVRRRVARLRHGRRLRGAHRAAQHRAGQQGQPDDEAVDIRAAAQHPAPQMPEVGPRPEPAPGLPGQPPVHASRRGRRR